jgi:hypothetical protein
MHRKTSSGTPEISQCRRRPDGPTSGSIRYVNSMAVRAAATRPTMVAACRCSRHKVVSAAFPHKKPDALDL